MQCVLVMIMLAIINCDTMLEAILVLFQRLWVEVLSLTRNEARILGTPPVYKIQFLMLMGAVSATLGVLALVVFFVLWTRLGFLDSQVFLVFRNLPCGTACDHAQLTWERGHHNVICYSDFLHTINLIQAPLQCLACLYHYH